MIFFTFKATKLEKTCGCKKKELIAIFFEKEIVDNPWRRPFER
jgi:hypothetical protein